MGRALDRRGAWISLHVRRVCMRCVCVHLASTEPPCAVHPARAEGRVRSRAGAHTRAMPCRPAALRRHRLEPGDIELIHNPSIFHSREPYVDGVVSAEVHCTALFALACRQPPHKPCWRWRAVLCDTQVATFTRCCVLVAHALVLLAGGRPEAPPDPLVGSLGRQPPPHP